MTHIENIPHIVEYGITHKNSVNSSQSYKTIGDTTLISTRDSFLLDNGSCLGDYIPFYFGFRCPMLYVIQKGFNGVTPVNPTEIIYCVSSVQKIIDTGIEFLYTDGHATDSFSSFYSPEQINDIQSQVDFAATNQKFWNDENDLDLKRRKEAEFLIKGDLEHQHILGFITFDETAKNRLMDLGVAETKIAIRPKYYF